MNIIEEAFLPFDYEDTFKSIYCLNLKAVVKCRNKPSIKFIERASDSNDLFLFMPKAEKSINKLLAQILQKTCQE